MFHRKETTTLNHKSETKIKRGRPKQMQSEFFTEHKIIRQVEVM